MGKSSKFQVPKSKTLTRLVYAINEINAFYEINAIYAFYEMNEINEFNAINAINEIYAINAVRFCQEMLEVGR